MDIREVPFSRRGSYLALSLYEGKYRQRVITPGIYLRTVHGKARDPLVARLIPLLNGEEAAYTVEEEPSVMRILINENSSIELAFADSDTLLIRGCGVETGLTIDYMAENGGFELAQPVLSGEETWYLADCFKNYLRLMAFNQSGELRLEQEWLQDSSKYSRMQLSGDKDGFLLVLEEVREDWVNRHIHWDFDEVKRHAREEFEAFYRAMPCVPEEFEETRKLAAYVDWSGIVNPQGFLTREAMFMSKNWMCNVWAWDHCFNAIAICENYPEMAWDQFILLFDHQTKAGRIPDSVNDSLIINNYCKPPIHGWALHKLRQKMTLSRSMIEEACDKLEKWTLYWLDLRDQDGDGLCEYTHGNDSGWDNASAFSMTPPVTAPDLAAFLILQMDELAELNTLLGRGTSAKFWKAQADKMLHTMTEKLFKNHLPIAIQTVTGKEIPTESLILYLPIVLGKRLPEKERDAMISVLKSDKFLTEYGFATEALKSAAYETDGYWRGPIWAPSTMIILDGLWQCGETEFVKKMAGQFCLMVKKSGCAENFDPLTGEGLCDRAYTWTASVMLSLANEYLM